LNLGFFPVLFWWSVWFLDDFLDGNCLLCVLMIWVLDKLS
jgi:hypothetical protein